MYGPKWPFLLTYESYVMRQTVFSRVDGLPTGPPGSGRHRFESLSCNLNIYSSFVYLKPIKVFLQKQLKVFKIKLVYLDSFSHLEQKNNHF